MLSFIGGLGGKNISPEEFEFIFDKMIRAVDTEIVEMPHLLYTENEWKKMKELKEIAGKG